MIKYLSLAVVACVTLACGSNAEKEDANSYLVEVSDSVTLKNVFEFLESYKGEELRSDEKKVQGFDFSVFKPLDSLSDVTDLTYRLKFGENGEIARITSETRQRELNFEFRVRSSNRLGAKVLLVNEAPDQNINPRITGIFVWYREQICFLGQDQFSPSRPLNKAHDISNVMLLDKNLFPVTTLRFDKGKLVFATRVNYKSKGHVFSETLLAPKEEYLLTDSVLLEEIFERVKVEDSSYVVEGKDRQISLPEGYEYRPLWVYGGNHLYLP